MKKLFLSLIAVVAGTMGSYAQSDLVATLSHSSTLTNYYGADALSEAYTAATAGDVITLSPGTFNAVDIEKAITVRGAAMYGLANGTEPTNLSGTFNITAAITLEGVDCKGYVQISGSNETSVKILKSRFANGVECNTNTDFVHCLLNCHDGQQVKYLKVNADITVHCINCVLMSPYLYSSNLTAYFTNCIISGDLSRMDKANLRNCAIIGRNDVYDLPNSVTANYCVAYYYEQGTSNSFDNITGDHNRCTAEGDEFFSTYSGWWGDIPETFELTETAASTYLGDDGTQVGIYGGTNPFDPTPTYTQISKFTVSSTTSNGKLLVTINVE